MSFRTTFFEWFYDQIHDVSWFFIFHLNTNEFYKSMLFSYLLFIFFQTLKLKITSVYYIYIVVALFKLNSLEDCFQDLSIEQHDTHRHIYNHPNVHPGFESGRSRVQSPVKDRQWRPRHSKDVIKMVPVHLFSTQH